MIQQSRVEEGMENVAKRTPSDPMGTGCRGKAPSGWPRVSLRESRRGWQKSANGLHRIQWRRVAVARVGSQVTRVLANT